MPHHEVVDEEVSDVDGLQRHDLRARAKSLGVPTHVGSKWRTTAELRRACVEKTKALRALPEAESVQAHHGAVDEEVSEFDSLLTDDLRARAKSLGVTTHVGSKWRTAVSYTHLTLPTTPYV